MVLSRSSHGKRQRHAPRGHLVLAVVAALSLLLTPMTARAGAGLPHAHAFLTLLLDGADGKLDHHALESAEPASADTQSTSPAKSSNSHPAEEIVNGLTVDGTVIIATTEHAHGSPAPAPRVATDGIMPADSIEPDVHAWTWRTTTGQPLTSIPFTNPDRGKSTNPAPDDTPSLENSVPAAAGIAFLAPDILLLPGLGLGALIWPRPRLLPGRSGAPLAPPPRCCSLV